MAGCVPSPRVPRAAIGQGELDLHRHRHAPTESRDAVHRRSRPDAGARRNTRAVHLGTIGARPIAQDRQRQLGHRPAHPEALRLTMERRERIDLAGACSADHDAAARGASARAKTDVVARAEAAAAGAAGPPGANGVVRPEHRRSRRRRLQPSVGMGDQGAAARYLGLRGSAGACEGPEAQPGRGVQQRRAVDRRVGTRPA